jgi:hypothetical protein
VGDWPIKEYLKRHFANQRGYQRRKEFGRARAAIAGKRKAKQRDSMDNWSDVDADNREGNEAGSDEGDEGDDEGGEDDDEGGEARDNEGGEAGDDDEGGEADDENDDDEI